MLSWHRSSNAQLMRLPDGSVGWLTTPPVIFVSGALLRFMGEEVLPPLYGRAYPRWEYDYSVYAWKPLHLLLRLAYWAWSNQYFIERWGHRYGFYLLEPNAHYSRGRWTWRRKKRSR